MCPLSFYRRLLNNACYAGVISLDLGWSEAVEAQAFDRVHRLGQLREVVVERLVINNTVEDRVLALQERKKVLADCSLGEGAGKKIGRLSVEQLANCASLSSPCADVCVLLTMFPQCLDSGLMVAYSSETTTNSFNRWTASIKHPFWIRPTTLRCARLEFTLEACISFRSFPRIHARTPPSFCFLVP